MATGRMNPPKSTQELIEVMAHVLTDDSFQGPIPQDAFEEIVRILTVLHHHGQAKDTAWRTMLIDPSDYGIESAGLRQAGDYFVSESVWQVIARIQDLIWRLVFRTTGDYLGSGSYNTRLGDMVVVFHGCSTASIIRPCEEKAYKFIGPAYVHGIMNGEFWQRGSESDDELFVLV
jgi:hypothetical protein